MVNSTGPIAVYHAGLVVEILNSIFSWVIKKRVHDIALFKQFPLEVQQELFQSLIKHGAQTFYGKQYGFDRIKTVEQYRDQVPVVRYEDLLELIIRTKHGEQQLLWPNEIKWFAKSSGTTNDNSKFIPLSKEALQDCHYKGGKDLLSLYYNGTNSARLFSGKSLIVGGTHELNQFSSDSYYGDLSAIIIQNLPYWVEYKRVPERSIALMSDWEDKVEKMARATMDQPITNISGVPSWTLVLLNKVLELSAADHIHQVWPDLELYMHGGVNFMPYKQRFDALLPKAGMHYMENYNASEGFFGIQEGLFDSDLLLMLDYGVFYEFAPQGEWTKDHPTCVGLDQVEVGEEYEMIITTNAGLWRYRLGDTIRFTQTYPFRIQVTGRTKHSINVAGEELMVHNAESALSQACKATQCQVHEFMVAPLLDLEGVPVGHQWVVEFTSESPDVNQFSRLLDQALQQDNSDYAAKRTGVLCAPQITEVPAGTFFDWMKSRGKLGGQHKVPRLSNDRKYQDDILRNCQELAD